MLSAREQFFNSDGGTAGIGLGIEIGESSTSKAGRGVYNATTVAVTKEQATNAAATPSATVPRRIKPAQLEPVVEGGEGEGDEELHFDTDALSNLPPRQPLDIEFKELSLTVKLGFNRGEFGASVRVFIVFTISFSCLAVDGGNISRNMPR